MAATGNGDSLRLGRARLLRIARLLAGTPAVRAEGAARVCALSGASGAASARWRRLPGGGRALEARVCAGAPLDSDLTQAWAEALSGSATEGPDYPASAAPARPPKVLLFRCLLESPGKEGAARLNQGTFYLASALRRAGAEVVLSEARVSRFARDAGERAALARRLDEHPGLDLVALGLYDAYFEDAASLVAFLRAHTSAKVALGALMPTRDPERAFVHLPGAHCLGRGAGEDLLPALARACAAWRERGGDDGVRGELLGLNGALAGDGGNWAVWGAAEEVRRSSSLDAAALDFSFYAREDAAAGPAFCLSRGCESACAFCTSPDRGHFHGMRAAAVGRALGAYGRRLKELYGSWSTAPREALSVGFYDDDALADRVRALELLALIGRSPFRLRFLQASVRAFYRPDGGRALGGLDTELLDALAAAPFDPDAEAHLYLGTESFCDAELERLGKGYRAEHAERLARELSRRGVRQAHHFIASNARTTPADVIESLSRIVRLREECGPAFAVLQPPIAHLVSFPGTASLSALRRAGLGDRALARSILRAPGFPEYDYPLMERDEPADPDAAAWAGRLKAKGTVEDWEAELEATAFEWLLLSERLAAEGREPERAARLRAAADAAARLAWGAA